MWDDEHPQGSSESPRKRPFQEEDIPEWPGFAFQFFLHARLKERISLKSRTNTTIRVEKPKQGTLAAIVEENIRNLAQKQRSSVEGTKLNEYSSTMDDHFKRCGFDPFAQDKETKDRFHQAKASWSWYFTAEKRETRRGNAESIIYHAKDAVMQYVDSDLKPGSTWTLKLLQKVFPGDTLSRCALPSTYPAGTEDVIRATREVTTQTLERISQRRARISKDDTPGLDRLRKETMTVHESDTRYVLDGLLQPVLKAAGVSLRTEILITGDQKESSGFATNRCDYLLFRDIPGHDSEVVGVIEAKRTGGDLQQALVQTVMQLLTLYSHKSGPKETSMKHLIGIATDSERYVIVILGSKTLYLPFDDAGPLIFGMETWDGQARAISALYTVLHPGFRANFALADSSVDASSCSEMNNHDNTPVMMDTPPRTATKLLYTPPSQSIADQITRSPCKCLHKVLGEPCRGECRRTASTRTRATIEDWAWCSTVAEVRERGDMTRGRWRLCVKDISDINITNNRDNERNNHDKNNTNDANDDDNDNDNNNNNDYDNDDDNANDKNSNDDNNDVDDTDNDTDKSQGTSNNDIISELSGFIIDALQHHSVFDGCVLRHDGTSLEIWCESCRKDALKQKLSGVVIREGLRFPAEELCWIPPRRRVQRPRTSLLP